MGRRFGRTVEILAGYVSTCQRQLEPQGPPQFARPPKAILCWNRAARSTGASNSAARLPSELASDLRELGISIDFLGRLSAG